MIQANELRIGNWVRLKLDPDLENTKLEIKVDRVHYDHLLPNRYLINSAYTTDVDPIPLTPEILEKAGFTFTKLSGICGQDEWAGFDLWQVNGNGVTLDFRGNKKGDFLILSGYFNCQIKYLHQLQNLYFALTNKELEIKL